MIARLLSIVTLVVSATSLAGAIPTTVNDNGTGGRNQDCMPKLAPDNSNANISWIGLIKHQGTSAFNMDRSYAVYRNVKDFGAVGDGIHDDSDAINAAIASGNRCGLHCAPGGTSTLTPALVYLPPGTYLISAPIVQFYYTQIVGDPVNRPVIKAAQGWTPEGKGYVGIYAMVDSNPYVPNGGGANWYQNQNNFYRSVRNIIFDTTSVPASNPVTGIHWQVAQATSLLNLDFIMAPGATSQHQGIWMENGSGGWIADLTFTGGRFGLWVGNQQFTSRNLVFKNVQTGIYLNWDWHWSFVGLSFDGCGVGLDLSSGGFSAATVLDSAFSNTDVAILISSNSPNGAGMANSRGNLLLDNVALSNVTTAVKSTATGAIVLAGGSKTVRLWGQGELFQGSSSAPSSGTINTNIHKARTLLDSNTGKFFTRPRPTYAEFAMSDFVDVKDFGAKGDGVTDDTAALQAVLDQNAGCKIIFVPAGTYILTSTLRVPVNTRMTGEAWSVLMARGAAFSSSSTPTPVVQVGSPGQAGPVELSDLLVSTQGPAPGALLMQWNVHDRPGHQGEVGMWDVHFRVGGAAGTNLQTQTCGTTQSPTSGGVNPDCVGAWGLLHLTQHASAYLENVWGWTADHDIEATSQVNVFSGRGLLSTSANGPVWMLGTAFEHNVLYQYQLVNSSNIFASMVQTETPYYQGGSKNPTAAPAPFKPDVAAYGDPTFDHCDAASASCAMGWSWRIVNSSKVFVYGMGLYSFFNDLAQDCLGAFCQDALVSVEGTCEALNLFGINTIGAKSMVGVAGTTAVPGNVFLSSAGGLNVSAVLGFAN
ncbi:hypothetical protein HK101_000520 [Irineochytrium annulatum]|nr:hypothetical protein HK101_000520 [Irineochytrium annulatum]